MKEQWKPVIGFDLSYQISDQGRLKSLSRLLHNGQVCQERIIPGTLNGTGRRLVVLQESPKKRTCFIYQLVVEAFIGPYPPNLCVNHKNGDRTDDRLENLEYITHQENSLHAARTLGTFRRGEAHHEARFTTSQVLELRNLWTSGKWKQRDLAKKYGVTQRAVWQIIHRITWNHI